MGAFRVLSPDDFGDNRHGHAPGHDDWRRLREQGLLTQETLTERHGTHHVVALTREGKDLLDAHATAPHDGRQQTYYAEVLKPRELAHDSRLYAAFAAEADRIEGEGGRVTRIVLDYELKSHYQQFLNREGRPDDANLDHDVCYRAAGSGRGGGRRGGTPFNPRHLERLS